MRVTQLPVFILGSASGLATLFVTSAMTLDSWTDVHAWLNIIMSSVIVALTTGLIAAQQVNQSQIELRRLRRTLNHWLIRQNKEPEAPKPTDSQILTLESAHQFTPTKLFECIDGIQNKAHHLLEEHNSFSREFDRLNTEIRQFSKLLNHFPVPVFFFNQQGEAVFINHSAWRAFSQDKNSDPLQLDDYPLPLVDVELVNEVKVKLQHLCLSYLNKTTPMDQLRQSGQISFTCKSNQKILGLSPNASDFDMYWIRLDSIDANKSVRAENGDLNRMNLVDTAHLAVMVFPQMSSESQKEAQIHFASLISHEMRTPLSSIKAYLEMLLDNEVETEAQRHAFYSVVQSEANRLDGLIDNLLTLYRLEAGILIGARERFDVHEMVKDIIEKLMPVARAKRIHMKQEMTPAAFLVVGDRKLIARAIYNLIENAIQYTPEAKSITLRLDAVNRDKGQDEQSQTQDMNMNMDMLFTVADQGLGIPSHELAHIFEKFYRVDNHRHLSRGTGLGLSLVQDVIEKVHHGRIWVESDVGQGSRFYVQMAMASFHPTQSDDNMAGSVLEGVHV